MHWCLYVCVCDFLSVFLFYGWNICFGSLSLLIKPVLWLTEIINSVGVSIRFADKGQLI